MLNSNILKQLSTINDRLNQRIYTSLRFAPAVDNAAGNQVFDHSGKFNVRASTNLPADIVRTASTEGKSLNQ